ncbi:hypothetical protein SELMODRAFT_118442, partial [Selaginella moellendorffii]
IQILSNRKYKSIKHQVLVQHDQTHLSIVAFCNPSQDVVIRPLPKLINEKSTNLQVNFV